MITVRAFVHGAICALAICCAGAQGQASPKDVLKSINEYRAQVLKEARESGKPISLAVLNDRLKAKAEEAIKGVDPSNVDAKDAYDWAQIFSMAGRHKEVCDLCHKFLTSSPTPEAKYAAQMLMMNSCNTLGESEMLTMTLKDIVPVNAATGRSLMSMTANLYADTIAKGQGVDEAIKVLDSIAAKLPAEDHKANAQKMLDAAKQREAQNPPATAPKSDAERLADFEASSRSTEVAARFAIVDKKFELLNSAGKAAEAKTMLKSFAAGVDPKLPAARTILATVKRMDMVSAPAVALNVERTYGDFKGLSALKGKVVLIDFFAHWCGPCKASYPEMRKMFDELNPKGLEIVGVTTYYGYYGQENVAKRDMPKDTEFAKMADFIKEFNIAWPVVYGDRTNFEAYGVTGIPQVTVIDRKGNIHSFDIGYSPALFKKFREEIEKLIAEK
jgi:thiol-disulfide isomerase/thioredoxin